ncbi:hypothetical protein JX266_004926 [Neoarthrinium moseri]|nr:hypothetical protein JX266_004926 [Neoarthrinium moseri]
MPMGEVDQSFINEVWILYAVGVVILVLRFVVRIKAVGLGGLQGDDYFSVLVLGLFTVDAAMVDLVYYAGTNVEASAVLETRTLTDDEIAEYTFGSKMELVAWYSYTALIWALKGTMLCFFRRLTDGLWQYRLVKWLMYACGASYFVVVMTVTFGCFPTQNNWQVVPDPGLQCTFKRQNFLVTVVFNVMTDAAILFVPVPLLWALQIPLRKKLVIGLLLCSGLFVITAAIIRVVLTLGAHPSALNVNRWGVRETIVGILTVNIPILRPMFSPTFWKTGQLSSAAGRGTTTTGTRTPGPLGGAKGPYEMTGGRTPSGRKSSFGGSEDAILNRNGSVAPSVKSGASGITVPVVYHVSREEHLAEQGLSRWNTSDNGPHTAYRRSGNVF